MKHLTRLTPAEALLATKNKDATLKELLKVTFIDLLMKQVLQTFEVEKEITNRDGIWVFTYVKEGSNFYKYKPLEHEEIFLVPFIRSKDSEILFRNFVKMAHQNAKTEVLYKGHIYESINIKNNFKRNIFQRIFGGATITYSGMEQQKEIKQEIESLKKELPKLAVSKPNEAYTIVYTILGCVALIETFDMSMLKDIDKDLLGEFYKTHTYIDVSSCGSMDNSFDFSDISSDFDSSCGGFSGCGDSGCSSGCSGCSGCGGCGGD